LEHVNILNTSESLMGPRIAASARRCRDGGLLLGSFLLDVVVGFII